ncbi:MAG: kelch repeat-containing protein [Gammaproteobacteria bacterium]|nr:kelch repeat-containing protein [Gammaproteobacteria bacterium]
MLLLGSAHKAQALEVEKTELPAMPAAVSNNGLVGLAVGDSEYIVSFAGLGDGRTHDDTLATTWVFDSAASSWSQAADVPGGVGRLASTAAAAGERAYIFGGYTVEEDGSEVSTPWTHAFDPVTGAFEERAAMPVPVDDSVAVTWQDRYIYLLSGWHNSGNVNLVQRYDTVEDTWVQATPIPGPGVFGQAGGIVGNTIVYCDGVAIEPHEDRRRDFVASNKCFLGTINPENPARIDWRTLPPHPGAPRYRMAAAGSAELGAVVFVGGSDNPYNYNGIGYNGEPSQPAAGLFLFDIEAGEWLTLDTKTPATMDHRALVPFRGKLITAGGMLADQQTTDRVTAYSITR